MNKHKQMLIFKTIVEAGSITKAAEKLELSKSVLSTHLKQLESSLELVLLKRTTRQQSLTPAGEKFYAHCVSMNDIVSLAWDDIRRFSSEPSGTLAITAPNALMEHLLIPALSKAFQPFPKVSLKLIADDHKLALMQNDIDLAIRVGSSPDSNYKQKKIGEFKDWLCQASSTQTTPAENRYIANQWQGNIIKHTVTHCVTKERLTWEFTAHHQANSINQVALMVEQGLGIGLIPEFIAMKNPNIERYQPQYELEKNSAYALHPYTGPTPKSVQLAINAIEEKLREMTV
ncbi:LysR family transcriptional regulator [Vibrio aquaticus]|uniref:LysR family transcriptional regulator n=1 Tax=Vibrio aquaticus TaxID=2496559 RepID=A0A432D1S5_9VIBR|nr:LysR family transcriptional regulator [Vibrio aquaticus]RTZ17805.1 LysR family transcriptional regulator [Vibrio aquaticus]